ncbi:MAG: hypothetical protein LBT89_00940 [Planctomycetaceae bacterium]|nr:hypothetical protein [Planctomycetaceae bacterium]
MKNNACLQTVKVVIGSIFHYTSVTVIFPRSSFLVNEYETPLFFTLRCFDSFYRSRRCGLCNRTGANNA